MERGDEVERVDRGAEENMLRAMLEEKISGRLQRGFYCKIHASEAQREHTQSRLKIYNTRARV